MWNTFLEFTHTVSFTHWTILISPTETKRDMEISRGAVYVYFLPCGDGIPGDDLCPNLSNFIHYTCTVLCIATIFQWNLKKKSKEDDKYSTAERTGQSLLSICIHYKKKKKRERAYLLSLIVPDKIKHIVLLLPLCCIYDSKYFLCR